MTRVEFYFNVPDKHRLVENIVQASLLKRRRVDILAADEQAASSISDCLWQNTATSFLPNVLSHGSNASASHVIIGLQGIASASNALNNDELLINLTSIQPSFFSRYTQLIELVGLDEADKVAGRARYKFYRDRGYEIKNIDINKS
jgi:DNA polymerase-3 subunit chi